MRCLSAILVILLCAALAGCKEEGKQAADTDPALVSDNALKCTSPFSATLTRVSPTAASLDLGTSVQWIVSASGCGGHFRLVETAATFSSTTSFSKGYFEAGTNRETVTVQALTDKGEQIEEKTISAPTFQVVNPCSTPITASLTRINPTTVGVGVGELVTWEVKAQGCTGSFKLPSSTSPFPSSIQFNKTYTQLANTTESVQVSSVDASGRTLASITATSPIDVVKCPTPLKATLTRMDPATSSVVQGETVRWRLSAEGCAGVYKIAGSPLFGPSTEYTKTYSDIGALTESVLVTAVDALGNILGTTTATASVSVSCSSPFQASLTKVSPAANTVDVGTNVSWKISAQGCTSNFKLASSGAEFTSGTPITYVKSYTEPQTVTESMQVQALDSSGNVLQTLSPSATLQVVSCSNPLQPTLTRISPTGNNIDVGTAVTWELMATGCSGTYKAKGVTGNFTAPIRFTKTYTQPGTVTESIQVSAIAADGTTIQQTTAANSSSFQVSIPLPSPVPPPPTAPQSPGIFTTNPFEGNPQRYFSGDFDGDGKVDSLTSQTQGTEAKLIAYLSSTVAADGTYPATTLFTNSSWGPIFEYASEARFFVGDFNGDKKDDLAFIPTTGSIIALVSNGASPMTAKPIFTPSANWAGVFGGGSAARFLAGDFNADGKQDLAFTYPDGNIWGLLSNPSNDTLISRVLFSKAEWGQSVFDVNSAARFFTTDLNGDGKTDLLFTFTDGAVWGLFSNGTGLTAQTIFSNAGWGGVMDANSPARFFAGDFNGDGRGDLLFTWVDGNVFGLFSNTADATLKSQLIYQNAAWGNIVFHAFSQARFYSGDFNGDGKKDLMFNYIDGNVFLIASNSSNNNFTSLLFSQNMGPGAMILYGRLLPRDFKRESLTDKVCGPRIANYPNWALSVDRNGKLTIQGNALPGEIYMGVLSNGELGLYPHENVEGTIYSDLNPINCVQSLDIRSGTGKKKISLAGIGEIAGMPYSKRLNGKINVLLESPGTVYGSYFDDNITGANGPDFIAGGPGNDRLEGGGGPDIIYGGVGDDFISENISWCLVGPSYFVSGPMTKSDGDHISLNATCFPPGGFGWATIGGKSEPINIYGPPICYSNCEAEFNPPPP